MPMWRAPDPPMECPPRPRLVRTATVRECALMQATTSRAMNCSKSPFVTELEYIDPLWTVFASSYTTIESWAPLATAPSMVWGAWISFDYCSAPML